MCWTFGGGGGGGASRRQSSVLESAEHLDAALLTDGSVNSGSAATMFVSIGGGGGGASRRQSSVPDSGSADAICVRVFVGAVVVRFHVNRACWSAQSPWTQLCSLMAPSTVDRLPSRVSDCRWRWRWCELTAVERAGVHRALGRSSAHRRQRRQGRRCRESTAVERARQWIG